MNNQGVCFWHLTAEEWQEMSQKEQEVMCQQRARSQIKPGLALFFCSQRHFITVITYKSNVSYCYYYQKKTVEDDFYLVGGQSIQV